MKLLTTIAVLTSLTAAAQAQTIIGTSNAPGTSQLQGPVSVPPTTPNKVPAVRPMGVTLELTVSSLGVGAEIGADLGYVGLVAGVAATIFQDNRQYIMARAQSRGNHAFYGGVGWAGVGREHGGTLLAGSGNGGDERIFLEKNEYVMFEGGVKGQWGMFTARAFVGADVELSSNCIASKVDCDHMPFYGGISTGFLFH